MSIHDQQDETSGGCKGPDSGDQAGAPVRGFNLQPSVLCCCLILSFLTFAHLPVARQTLVVWNVQRYCLSHYLKDMHKAHLPAVPAGRIRAVWT